MTDHAQIETRQERDPCDNLETSPVFNSRDSHPEKWWRRLCLHAWREVVSKEVVYRTGPEQSVECIFMIMNHLSAPAVYSLQDVPLSLLEAASSLQPDRSVNISANVYVQSNNKSTMLKTLTLTLKMMSRSELSNDDALQRRINHFLWLNS